MLFQKLIFAFRFLSHAELHPPPASQAVAWPRPAKMNAFIRGLTHQHVQQRANPDSRVAGPHAVPHRPQSNHSKSDASECTEQELGGLAERLDAEARLPARQSREGVPSLADSRVAGQDGQGRAQMQGAGGAGPRDLVRVRELLWREIEEDLAYHQTMAKNSGLAQPRTPLTARSPARTPIEIRYSGSAGSQSLPTRGKRWLRTPRPESKKSKAAWRTVDDSQSSLSRPVADQFDSPLSFRFSSRQLSLSASRSLDGRRVSTPGRKKGTARRDSLFTEDFQLPKMHTLGSVPGLGSRKAGNTERTGPDHMVRTAQLGPDGCAQVTDRKSMVTSTNHANSNETNATGDPIIERLAESDEAHQLLKQSELNAMTGNWDKSLECARAVQSTDPTNPVLHLRIAKAYQGMNKWSEADMAIKAGLEWHPNDPDLCHIHREIKVPLLRERGMAMLRAGSPDEAIAAFTEALAAASENDDKYWLLIQRSRVYFSKKDEISALDDTAECIAIDGTILEGYERHCDCLVAIGDFVGAKICAQIGLMHAVNFKNEVLENLIERIDNGAMPKVVTARVFIRQITRHDTEDFPRILKKWDKHLRKDMYERTMVMWKQQLIALVPNGDTESAPSLNALGLIGKIKRQAGVMRKSLTRRDSHSDGSVFVSGLTRMDAMTEASSLGAANLSLNSSNVSRAPSSDSLGRSPSISGLSMASGRSGCMGDPERVTDISQQLFKYPSTHNRELFVQLAIIGWQHIKPLLEQNNAQEQAALHLQLGFAYLEKIKIGTPAEGFDDERQCISALQTASVSLDGITDEDLAAQRAAVHSGLAEIYEFRREGDHMQNLLESASHVNKTLNIYTFDTEPHRFIAGHHKMGDLYIEAGEVEKATSFLSVALKLLDDVGSTSWNTLSGIKFLRARTHCKLAEACIRANQDLNPEHDGPTYQFHVDNAIEHYECALQVYVLHLYPLEHVRTLIQLCNLRGISGKSTTFQANGVVCVFQGQRARLLQALTGFKEALSMIEAITVMMFVTEVKKPVELCKILKMLGECFSGCIQTSTRMGMYAQALGYSERAHSYSTLRKLLQEPCRQDLLQGLPARLLTRFSDLVKKLGRHCEILTLDEVSKGNFKGMLHDSVQMVQLLNDMAACSENMSNEKLRLLGLTMPKVIEEPCVFIGEPVQDCETAVLEFFFSDMCGYVFVQCWKEDTPRTIEYTADQLKIILSAIKDLQMPGFVNSPRTSDLSEGRRETDIDLKQDRKETLAQDARLMRSLERISDALRIDTILKAAAPTVRRLIIVPHGPLMAVPLHLLPLGSSSHVASSSVHVNSSSAPSIQQAHMANIFGGSINPTGVRSPDHINTNKDHVLSWRDDILLDRFPLGIMYSSSLNVFTWLQERDALVRFAPMLQCLHVGRPAGTKDIPALPVFIEEGKCFKQIFRKHRGMKDVEASEKSITKDPKELLAVEGGGKMDKTAVTTHSADVLHFSCFSETIYDTNCEEMDMKLKVAGDEQNSSPKELTTGSICTWKLPVCRVVSLASNVQKRQDLHTVGHKASLGGVCGSGAYLAWLLAGASAVVSSAWYVGHECKIVFFSKLYEAMTLQGLDVAQALLSTQRWLRTATHLDYVRGFPKEWQNISWSARVEKLEEEEQTLITEGTEIERPFASPFWWAGYSVWGDGNICGKHALKEANKEGGYDYDAIVSKYVGENEDSPAKETQNDAGPASAVLGMMHTFTTGVKRTASNEARIFG